MKERPEAGRDYRDEFYAAYSTAIDAVHADERTAWRQFESRWQQWLPNDRSVPMLDIGCGSGVFVRFLRSCGFANVTGVDRSVSETTRAHASGTDGVVCDDARSFLGARRDAYGLVAALNIFEHLRKEEVLDLLRVLHGALRPGGQVLIVTPNGLSPFGGATPDPALRSPDGLHLNQRGVILMANTTTTAITGVPVLRKLQVTPSNPSLPVGTRQQLRATGTYTDGSTADLTAAVTWSSSDPSVASVDANGLATGIAPGSATVTASSGTMTAVAYLDVSAAALVPAASIRHLP